MREGVIEAGDAKELSRSIPDNSVDMIFTDPVYQNIEDYDWLGREADRILKPDKPMIVWISSQKIKEVRDALDPYLTFRLPLFYVVTAKMYFLNAYHAFPWTTPMLVYSKGIYKPRAWYIDTFISGARPRGSHKWNKNEAVVYYYMQRIGYEGDVVWDPFCGGGTVPAVCKRLGRRFYASEIIEPLARTTSIRVGSIRRDLF